MSILVLAEHNNVDIKSSTLNTISAASQISGKIDVLVTGYQCEELAKKISKCEKVSKVIFVDNEMLQNPIAENIEPIVLSVAENYSHIMAPATTFGKNIFPRIAVKLDLAQVSDVIKIISDDTFMRPIYAGNAIATVKSKDKTKIVTIRPTSFDPIEISGGSENIENLNFDIHK
jgi:Electron transfer flavoprotein, alpha subunit